MNNIITEQEFLTLLELQLKNKQQKATTFLQTTKLTGFAYNKHNIFHAINMHFPNLEFAEVNQKTNYGFIWGHAYNEANCTALLNTIEQNGTVILCEDGFIRSYDTWCGSSKNKDLLKSCSTIFDTQAYYFDARKISTLEQILNDKNFVVSNEQKAEARKLIDFIVLNKLSKYNHQPLTCNKQIGNPGKRKVLVVDQSFGDFSIKCGLANGTTFKKMLDKAQAENPDADILVKTHPDTMTGKRGGYYSTLKETDRVFKITFPINPYTLLSLVDKVYVCSTQFGFEALMANKEVHTFGMPFYANWGLTIDDQILERRSNKRSLEEIFYIFYCLYTHWCNPITQKACSITEALATILSIRNIASKEK